MTDEQLTILREKLAEYAHEAWAGWMKWEYEKRLGTSWNKDTEIASYPVQDWDRWRRQMKTPYSELPEHEKESDRNEADRMISIFMQVGLL